MFICPFRKLAVNWLVKERDSRTRQYHSVKEDLPFLFCLTLPYYRYGNTLVYDEGMILFIRRLFACSNIRGKLRIDLVDCFQAAVSVSQVYRPRVFLVQMDVNCENEKAFLCESTTASKSLFPLAEQKLHPVSLCLRM